MSNIYNISFFLDYLNSLLDADQLEVNVGTIGDRIIYLSIADAITLITELKNEGWDSFIFNVFSTDPLVVSACPVTENDGHLSQISKAQLN